VSRASSNTRAALRKSNERICFCSKQNNDNLSKSKEKRHSNNIGLKDLNAYETRISKILLSYNVQPLKKR